MEKLFAAALCACGLWLASPAAADEASLHALITQHAVQNNIPEALVHRVVRRESNYNPRAIGRGGALGLMQIKHATARGLGYAGSPEGLLDAHTNLTYAVRYLAGAYRVADGNLDRAVSYYASGYYYVAKRRGMGQLTTAQAPLPDRSVADVQATASIPPTPAPQAGVASSDPQLTWADQR
jgi:soluble lytic murein transglycosylase-like protein